MLNKLMKFLSIDDESVEQRHANLRLRASSVVRDLCLSCSKCSALAAPIISTSRRYRCLSCGRQFEASTHNVEQSLARSGKMSVTAARIMATGDNYEKILILIK